MFRQKYFLCSFIFFCVLLLAVTQSIAANRNFADIDTVRIGCLTNFHAAYGLGQMNAVKLAVEEINADGGILGKKIEVFYQDTEGKAEKAIAAFKKVVLDDAVDIVIGPSASGASLAVQPHLSKYNIVAIATASAAKTLTDNVEKNYDKNKYFFRAMVNTERQKNASRDFLLEFVHKKLGYNKIAILAENSKWTHDLAPGLKKDLEAKGVKVVYLEMFDTDIKDFTPIFTKIKSSGAQWIAQMVAHSAAIPLVKAWQDTKPAPMGNNNVASTDSKFWEQTGGKCLYEVTYNFIGRAPLTEKTIPMWDKYVERFKTNPIFPSGFSYDAVYMLAEVIKQKRSVKTQDLIDGLENIEYSGVLHPRTAFDKKSHDLLEGRYVVPFVQWQPDGKQVTFFPEKLKAGDYLAPSWWKQN